METAPEFEQQPSRSFILNANSGISIALMILVIGGVIWIKDGQSTAEIARKSDETIRAKELAQMEMSRVKDSAEHARDIAEVKVQMANISRDFADKGRDRITFTEIWHWANQLQRANNDAGIKLIVPEPQHVNSSP